jgi:hypothetical protein
MMPNTIIDPLNSSVLYPGAIEHGLWDKNYTAILQSMNKGAIKNEELRTTPNTMIGPLNSSILYPVETERGLHAAVLKSMSNATLQSISKNAVKNEELRTTPNTRHIESTVTILLEEEDVKELKHRNWEFKIAHPEMLCIDEIVKYVSRENPVAIAQGQSCIHMFIHPSLIAKAEILDMLVQMEKEVTSTETLDNLVQHVIVSPTNRDSIIKWARKVKKAPWKKHDAPENIRVIIPKI